MAALMAAILIPFAVRLSATPPFSTPAVRLGVLLARLVPAGPIIESRGQATDEATRFFVPLARGLGGDDVTSWIAEWSSHLAICGIALWSWSRFGHPALDQRAGAVSPFIRSFLRTVLYAACWAFAVALVVTQTRIALASLHNETLGSTWQIYNWYSFRLPREYVYQEWAGGVLYVMGVFAIARREVRLSLRQPLDGHPPDKCRFCGYQISGQKTCPECGRAIDGATATNLFLGPAHAQLAKSWWNVGFSTVLILVTVAGLVAPLTHGLIWTVRTKLGL